MSICRNIVFLMFFHFTIRNLSAFAQSAKKIITVPNVVRMTVKEARKTLSSKNWGIGAIIYQSELENPDSLIIIRQTPPAMNTKGTQNLILKVMLVDIWVVNSIGMADTLNKPERNIRVVTNDF